MGGRGLAVFSNLTDLCDQYDTCFIKICSAEADLRAFENQLPHKYFQCCFSI